MSATVKLPDAAIDSLDHTWPGQVPLVKLLGKSARNVSANEMMWAFFVRHPMK
jgi:polyhydroxybutyrate depolymerase